MDDKRINIAVVLSAYDKMTAIVNQTVSATTRKLQQLQKFSEAASKSSMAYGRESLTTGVAAAAPLLLAAKAYADQEEAALSMRTAMMQDGGRINEKAYSDLVKFASHTSETLTGSTADYLRMVKVLQENSIKPNEILGGIGEATAQLSVFFKMAPDQIAQFAARMKQDMGVVPKEMGGMMDFIARLHNAGVGKDGAEAVTEMGEAFSKAGLGAHNLGVSGLAASKDLGALMAIFIRRGLSGQTVGNNFRRIFDGLRDGEKLKKANDVAKQFGFTLDFYDKDHKFKGIAAFTAELNKLKGLTTTQVSQVLKPFSGKQGLSTDFLEFLAKDGTEAFNGIEHTLSAMAMMQLKVAVQMGGLANSFERMKTTALNSAAAFASTYGPELKKLINNFNTLFSKVTNFINTHKELVGTIAKGIAYFAAYKILVGAGAMAFGGLMKGIVDGIKILGVAGNVLMYVGRFALVTGTYMGRLFMLFLTRGIPAMISFTAQVWANAAAWLANPATYIILAIIAAIAALIAIGIVIYNNWDKILTWFQKKWVLLKAAVSGMISVMKLFLDVVIGVGKALLGAFTFNPKLMVEGAKQAATAVNSIANGGISKAFAEGVNSSLKSSNARITRDGEVTLLDKKPVANKAPVTHNYHYSPTINVHPGANVGDGKTIVKTGQDQFSKFLKQHQAKQERVSYNH